MALATTTLTSAVLQSDNQIAVASATSVAAGRFILIDDEWMQVTKGYVTASLIVPVARGLHGSVQCAHVITANVTHGEATDFSTPPGQSFVGQPFQRAVRIVSYTAAGAIALPKSGEDLRVILNGTTGYAMTLAAPTKDLDGCLLTIIANGNTATNTVTIAAGLGGAGGSYDVITFNANGQAGFQIMACNGDWVLLGPMGGTLTNAQTTVA